MLHPVPCTGVDCSSVVHGYPPFCGIVPSISLCKDLNASRRQNSDSRPGRQFLREELNRLIQIAKEVGSRVFLVEVICQEILRPDVQLAPPANLLCWRFRWNLGSALSKKAWIVKAVIQTVIAAPIARRVERKCIGVLKITKSRQCLIKLDCVSVKRVAVYDNQIGLFFMGFGYRCVVDSRSEMRASAMGLYKITYEQAHRFRGDCSARHWRSHQDRESLLFFQHNRAI